MTTITRLTVAAQGRAAQLHQRAKDESEEGDVTQTVILIAGFALLAGVVVAAITALVNGKLGTISL